MVFSKRLHDEAMDFLKTQMSGTITNTTDTSLLTWEPNWRLQRRYFLTPEETPAYLAIHMRRQDFVKAHRELVPSVRSSAEQAVAKLRQLNLTTLFVATDAPESGEFR